MAKAPTILERRTTIRDVAIRAGVSISTVSHVFSGARPISQATREKVLATARALSYYPSAAAQSMRHGDTRIIGLVLRPRDAISGALRGTETFGRLIGAVAAHVLKSGRSLILVQDLLDNNRRNPPMDGCIVAYPYGDDEVLTYLMEHRVPTVTINPDPNRPGLPWVVHSDYAAPMEAVLEQFYQNGAREIALISGTEDNAWNRHTLDAYLTWTARKNVSANHISLYEGEAKEGAHRVLDKLLTCPTPPDAVIVAASTFAVGALEAIHSHRLRIPKRIFLAALTDSEYTRNAFPGITALDLRLEDLADEAVRLLLQRLSGMSPQTWPSVTPVVRWRASSGGKPSPQIGSH